MKYFKKILLDLYGFGNVDIIDPSFLFHKTNLQAIRPANISTIDQKFTNLTSMFSHSMTLETIDISKLVPR